MCVCTHAYAEIVHIQPRGDFATELPITFDFLNINQIMNFPILCLLPKLADSGTGRELTIAPSGGEVDMW